MKTKTRKMFINSKWCILKILKKWFLWRHSNIKIGSFTYGIPNVLFGKEEKTSLSIGKFCSLPHKRVTFLLGGEHPINWVSTFPFNMDFVESESEQAKKHPKSKGDINVGHDVWFGINSTVLSGVTIGNGAVIGSGALVTKDVPSYAVVGGVPARIICYRFNERQIESLLKINWWDWEHKKIREVSPRLMSDKIDDFIEQHLP